MHFRAAGFVVSADHLNIRRNYSTLPIYSIEKLPYDKDACSILLTMGGGAVEEVRASLKEKQFSYVYYVEDWDSCNMALREMVFWYILRIHGAESS